MTKRNAALNVVVILALLFVSASTTACGKGPIAPTPPPTGTPSWSTINGMSATPTEVDMNGVRDVTYKATGSVNQDGLTYTQVWVLIDSKGSETELLKGGGVTQKFAKVEWGSTFTIPRSPGEYTVEMRWTESNGVVSNTTKASAKVQVKP